MALVGCAIFPVIRKVHQVEDGCGEVADLLALLMRDVASHRQGLEVNFRAGDCRANVEEHAAFEILDGAGENQEIGVAGLTKGSTIAVGMGVDDVGPDGDVAGAGNAFAIAGSGDGKVTMREAFFLDGSADCFTEALIATGRFADDVVESARFFPEAKLAFLDVFGNVFRSAADQGKLEVVDEARAVGGEVGDEATLDQVDEVTGEAELDGVASGEKDEGTVVTSKDKLNELRKYWILEGSHGQR